jgi:hypothetical protein
MFAAQICFVTVLLSSPIRESVSVDRADERWIDVASRWVHGA